MKLVHELDQQADHGITYLLLCRDGDYATEMLYDLREIVSKKKRQFQLHNCRNKNPGVLF
jgi:hypothetical protein